MMTREGRPSKKILVSLSQTTDALHEKREGAFAKAKKKTEGLSKKGDGGRDEIGMGPRLSNPQGKPQKLEETKDIETNGGNVNEKKIASTSTPGGGIPSGQVRNKENLNDKNGPVKAKGEGGKKEKSRPVNVNSFPNR